MYNSINEAAEAHLQDLVTSGYTYPGYSSEVATTLMNICSIYETELTSQQKATLPAVENYNSIPDVLYRLLTVMRMASTTTVQVKPITIRENGTYTPDAGEAYGPVTVSVT